MGLAISIAIIVLGAVVATLGWFMARQPEPEPRPIVAPPVALPRAEVAATLELEPEPPRTPTDATIDRVSDEIIAWIEHARRGPARAPVLAAELDDARPGPTHLRATTRLDPAHARATHLALVAGIAPGTAAPERMARGSVPPPTEFEDTAPTRADHPDPFALIRDARAHARARSGR